MTKKCARRAMSKPAATASSKQPADGTGTTTRNGLKDAGRTALAKGKSAGQRIAAPPSLRGRKPPYWSVT